MKWITYSYQTGTCSVIVNDLRGALTESGTYKSNVASICHISLQRLHSTEIIKVNHSNYYYVLGISPIATQVLASVELHRKYGRSMVVEHGNHQSASAAKKQRSEFIKL
ncbi:hypothetical protein TrispH2_006866 [Trichoplax sp. H2]|nr:hypothetical protein TrispH2_006866 [Trichoplax sp. H2]|eukprot:RDD40037.1 hypothetical protein TrispH2_006866 [Trichoplax sp. H2]